MPICKTWDIVRVPFPYTDRPVRQHRPALVIAAAGDGGARPLLWVLMITSAGNAGWDDDVAIADLKAAGLPSPSVVRTAKVATIEAADAEPIGAMPRAGRAAVRKQLQQRLAAVLA